MSFMQSGSETRIYRISSDNNLDGMYGGRGQLSQHNSLTSFDDDAENFLLNFLMYVQIARTDIYMTTEYCMKNTASLQNQKYLLNLKQDRIENIFVAVDHQLKDTGVVHQFTETAIFIAKPAKKHIQQFILPVGSFFVNLST